jgi:hypothetical protein
MNLTFSGKSLLKTFLFLFVVNNHDAGSNVSFRSAFIRFSVFLSWVCQ